MTEENNLTLDLSIPSPTTQAFHNNSLTRFNELLYDGIFTVGNITSKEQLYDFKNEGKHIGYRLEKASDRKVYFIKSKDVDKLPLKITKTIRDSFRTDVLHLVKGVKTVNIPSSKDASFRNIIEWLCNFKHTNPLHWKLYKIIGVVSAIDRINYRVITNAGFGKDSVVDAITELVNQTANIYGATFAKLEYNLKNNFLFFNEMGNLSKDDKFNMQSFLLDSGAYRNKYMKRSRKSNGTKEVYDVSNTTIGIASNPLSYYRSKKQQSFIDMFTQAVINRFLPFRFEGELTHEFETNFNADNVVSKNKNFYKKIISTLNWYRDNNMIIDGVDWHYNPTRDFGRAGSRYSRTYNVLSKYISLYAESKEEYKQLVDELYKSYKRALKEDAKDYGDEINYEDKEGLAKYTMENII